MSDHALDQQQRAAVVAEAMTWRGTPYHHHARIKGAGVDCAQLLCAVFEACALVPPIDPGFYPTDWHLHRSEQMFSAWLQRFATQVQRPPEPGDVVLWQFGRTFSHGSICAGGGLFIHSYIGRGVILSRDTEEPLDGRCPQRWSFWP